MREVKVDSKSYTKAIKNINGIAQLPK